MLVTEFGPKFGPRFQGGFLRHIEFRDGFVTKIPGALRYLARQVREENKKTYSLRKRKEFSVHGEG